MYKTAVQAFALRDELEKNFEATLEAVISGGFDGFECGMYFGQESPQVSDEVKKIIQIFGKIPGCIWPVEEAGKKIEKMKEKGLIVESSHLFFTNAYEGFWDDYLDQMIAFGKEYGFKQYVVGLNISSEDEAKKWLPILDKAAGSLKKHGIRLAYHNQDMEMVDIKGKSLLETILDQALDLYLQPDLGWMEAGGGHVKTILEKYRDRILSIHFKDLYLEPWKEKKLICTPIGGGDVDSLVVGPLLDKMELLDAPLIIDQDNARGGMMAELIEGKDYIINHLEDK